MIINQDYTTLKTSDGFYLRPFNIVELQQIQGFPKDYTFAGNHKDKFEIGNAIPPKLVEDIVSRLTL